MLMMMRASLAGKLVVGIFLMALITMALTAGRSENDVSDAEQNAHFDADYNIYAIPLPDSLFFAGGEVPLDDPDIRERFDRELLVNTYWQSNTLLLIKRSARWLPEMKKIFREEGVPEDLVYISLVESGLQNVVSPAGATGFWQFMEETALDYDLEINDEVDERYHPVKSTYAAARFLKWSHGNFGSWTLAAASYNMGRRGLLQQMERQKADNYYDLLLNEETARYVFRIIAIKTIVENPGKYGFIVRESDIYPPHKTQIVVVDSSVEHLADFAAEHGINYKTLKYYNPWLRDNYLTNTQKKKYEIEIPIDKSFIDG